MFIARSPDDNHFEFKQFLFFCCCCCALQKSTHSHYQFFSPFFAIHIRLTDWSLSRFGSISVWTCFHFYFFIVFLTCDCDRNEHKSITNTLVLRVGVVEGRGLGIGLFVEVRLCWWFRRDAFLWRPCSAVVDPIRRQNRRDENADALNGQSHF